MKPKTSFEKMNKNRLSKGKKKREQERKDMNCQYQEQKRR